MPSDRQYNMDRQLLEIMNVVKDILEYFGDIKFVLDLGEDFPTILSVIDPPFNPLKTIGKYSA
jgi:hypothetical protein